MKLRKLIALLLTLAMVLPMAASIVPVGAEEGAVSASVLTQSWDFSDESQLEDFALYQSATSAFCVTDGALVSDGADGEVKAIVDREYTDVKSISVDMIPGTNGINGAIYLGASNADSGVDQINSLAFLVESNYSDANAINVIVGSFPVWTELERFCIDADHGNAIFTDDTKAPVNLRLDLDDDNITVTLSLTHKSDTYTQAVYRCDTASLEGQIGLRSFLCDTSFDNFTVTYAEEMDADLQRGLTFTGENSKLVSTDAPISQIPNTIEMWVKMNPRTNDSNQKYRQALISSVDPDGSNCSTAGDFELLLGPDGSLWWYEVNEQTIADTTSELSFEWKQLNSSDFCTSLWTHIALTRQEGSVILYVNGEQAGAWESDLIGYTAVPENPVTFGYSALQSGITRNNLDGSIGDVRLWSNTRTQEEIQADMKRALTGEEEGLINYWTFDERSGEIFNDSVAKGVNGTVKVQAVAFSEETGLAFDGVNEKLVKFNEPVSNIPNTVEMWVYLNGDAEGHYQSLINAYSGKTQAPALVGDWSLDIRGGKLRWVDKTALGQSGQLWGSTVLPTDQWVHVAVTRESGSVKFYINGELDITRTYAKYEDVTASTTVPTMGYSIFDTHEGTYNYLDGAMKEVRLWSTTRTAEEIEDGMSNMPSGAEEGLMNYWRLDETDGSLITDSAGENHGTISGSSTSWLRFAGVEFLGYNQTVIEAQTAIAEIPKTVEMWVWLDSDSKAQHHGLISAYSSQTQAPSAVGDWNLDIVGGNLRWVDHTSIGTSGQLSCAVAMPTDQWVHLAVTRALDTISFYLNGELLGTVDYSKFEETTTSVTKPVLGKSIFDTHLGATSYFDGKIKDVRLWNITRTEEEIQADMSAVLTGAEDGLMNYWKIDEIEGTVLTDCTAGNDFHISEMTCVSWDQEPEAEVIYENEGIDNSHGDKLRTLNNVSAAVRSVEAWVKVPAAIEDNSRLTVISAYPNVNFHLDVYTNGRPRLWFQNAAGSGAHFIVNDVDLRTNRWTHIAFVLDESAATLTCYINGEAVQTFTDVGTALTVNKLYVARDDRTGWQYPFMGQVADIRVWEKSLSREEISFSMMTSDIGTQEGLLLNLPLDEGDDADVYYDYSGNENNVMIMPNNLTWIDVEKKPSDYSIAIIPDQQYLTASYVDKLNGIYQWIADNAEAENMQMVINLGDITDNNSQTHWERALTAYNLIKDKTPYLLVAGNHDYNWSAYRDATNLNTYFPLSMFEQMDTFGGAYCEDDVQNTWQQFEIMGNKYLILALEFCPRDTVLEWANEVVAAHPEHQTIVVTHGYVDYDGTWLEGNDSFGADTYTYIASETEQPNDAAEMWDKFVRKHENIIMVLSGHIFASEDVVVKTDIGDHGNEVKQFLIDAQWLDSKCGGLGLVAMMNFSNDGQDVEFTYYCPYMGKYMNQENQFTFTLPAQKTYPAQVGDSYFKTVVEAVENANGETVILRADCEEAIEITADITIDLAGYSLSNVTVSEGAKLSLVDSASTYETAGGSAAVTGDVEMLTECDGRKYMVIGEDGVYAAHRYYAGLTHTTLNTANTGFGYKAQYKGDETVQAQVASIGYQLWIDGGRVVTRSQNGFKNSLTLLLKNFDIEKHGETVVYARIFMTLANGETVYGATHSSSMRQMVQGINTSYADFSAGKLQAVAALISQHETMQGWEVANILASQEASENSAA